MIRAHLKDVVKTGMGLNVTPDVAQKDIKLPTITYNLRSNTIEKRPDKGIHRLYSIDYVIHCKTYAEAVDYQEKFLSFMTYYDEYIEVDGRLLHVVCDDINVADLFWADLNQITLLCNFTVFEFDKPTIN